MNMKKMIIIAAMLLMPAAAFAQDELLKVTPEDDNMTVSVAGFDIKLGPADSRAGGHRYYTSFEGLSSLNMGIATIMCGNEMPEIRIPRSWYFSTDLVSVGIHGRANGTPFFDTGIRLSYYNYRLDDGRALTITDSGIPQFVDGSIYDKSKFKLTYLGVPVTMGMRIKRNFRISATATFDMLVDARNKVKTPKYKTRLNDLNPYRTSLEIAVHGSECGMFVNYGLTSIYKESSGLDAHTLTIGVRLFD